MTEIINEEISFSDGNNSVSVGASSKSKMTVSAAWSEYCGEYCSDTSRSIPIQDLFKYLRNRNKYIEDKAKELYGNYVKELDTRLKVVEDNNKDSYAKIQTLEERLRAYKMIIKDLKTK